MAGFLGQVQTFGGSSEAEAEDDLLLLSSPEPAEAEAEVDAALLLKLPEVDWSLPLPGWSLPLLPVSEDEEAVVVAELLDPLSELRLLSLLEAMDVAEVDDDETHAGAPPPSPADA